MTRENFIKRFGCTALAATLALSFTACSLPTQETGSSGSRGKNSDYSATELNNTMDKDDLGYDKIEVDTYEEIRQATVNFTMDIFKETLACESNQNANVMISPLSIQSALGMAANGADGKTLEEMEMILAGDHSIDDYNAYMNMLSTSSALNLANSIWIRDDSDRIQVKDEFVGINHYIYDADSFLAPFDHSTVNDINSWVNDKTDEMIPELLDDISNSSVIYIINAAAFDSKWDEPYTDDQVHEDREFTNIEGDTENVTMLYSGEGIYICDDYSTGFIKYYKDQDYAFMAILPDEGISLNEYIDTLDGDGLISLYDNRHYIDVNVCIPEFTSSYNTILNAPLMNMGMESAFGSGADFSNMAETGSNELYISEVIHKTYISLDRNGTRAAAVTAIAMTDGCALIDDEPKYVYLDRPFLYAIIDTDTGLPVFIGTVNSVNGLDD